MPETARPNPNGPSRRAVLKASAWSLPVVALAVATPLAAASATGDVSIAAQARGSAVSATGPDGTTLELAVPAGFDLTTGGTTRTPEGALVTLTFDNRLLDEPTLTMDSSPAQRTSLQQNGVVTTATFILPFGIPANGTTIPIEVFFATFNATTWVGDARPLTVTVTPAGGSDPDTANNTFVSTAVYTAAP
ncbi:hypothetical protein [Microbacterium sp. NPDC055665]